MMDDYVQSVVDFEKNVQDGLLDVCATLEVKLQLPVVAELVQQARLAIDCIRAGKPVNENTGARTLQDAIETLVREYDESLQNYYRDRAKAHGVSLSAGALTRIEKDALKTFIMWAVIQDLSKGRQKTRQHQLQRALSHDEES